MINRLTGQKPYRRHQAAGNDDLAVRRVSLMPELGAGVKGIMLRDAGVEPDLLQERAGYTTRALHPSGVLNPALPDETLSAELHP